LSPAINDKRFDLITYVYGRSPREKNNTRINPNAPDENYTGGRPLEAVEIHLHDVDSLVKEVYGKQD